MKNYFFLIIIIIISSLSFDLSAQSAAQKNKGKIGAISRHRLSQMDRTIEVDRQMKRMGLSAGNNPQAEAKSVSDSANSDHRTLAKQLQDSIGFTACHERNQMFRTLNAYQEIQRLEQTASNVPNGVLYYTAPKYYWGDVPAAEITIIELHADGSLFKGARVRHITLDLNDGGTQNYSLPDGYYKAEVRIRQICRENGRVYIANPMVHVKKFEVHAGERVEGYKGKIYEFKVGFDLRAINYNYY